MTDTHPNRGLYLGPGFRICLDPTLRLLGLFGAFWGKAWALGAKVWDPTSRVQEPWGKLTSGIHHCVRIQCLLSSWLLKDPSTLYRDFGIRKDIQTYTGTHGLGLWAQVLNT